jgi:hypothetical protein
MKLLLIIGLIAACLAPNANASELETIEAKIQQLKESVESQVERMKLIRERSANEMGLVRARIEGQLSRSQDGIAVQLAALERLREQLGDDVTGAKRAVGQFQGNIKMSMDNSVLEIDRQIRETNSLLRQMELMKQKIAEETGQCENPDITIEPVGGTPASPDGGLSGDSSPNPGGDGTSGTNGTTGGGRAGTNGTSGTTGDGTTGTSGGTTGANGDGGGLPSPTPTGG